MHKPLQHELQGTLDIKQWKVRSGVRNPKHGLQGTLRTLDMFRVPINVLLQGNISL
jgi:hypothetical protein